MSSSAVTCSDTDVRVEEHVRGLGRVMNLSSGQERPQETCCSPYFLPNRDFHGPMKRVRRRALTLRMRQGYSRSPRPAG
jgi:hypothetical protein